MSQFNPQDISGLILAGGELEESLKPYENVPGKALLTFGAPTPLVARVGQAMAGLGLQQLAVVSGEAVLANPPTLANTIWLKDQGALLDNVLLGLQSLKTPWVLMASVDLPFLQTAHLQNFLNECARHEADVYVPLLGKEVIEKTFPGAKRTYGALVEGRLTSGNVFLVRREALLAQSALLKDLIAMRKKPLRLALRVGVGVLLKLLFKRLRVADVEGVIHRLTGATAKAVFATDAALGMDVDKPADYELARETLGKPGG